MRRARSRGTPCRPRSPLSCGWRLPRMRLAFGDVDARQDESTADEKEDDREHGGAARSKDADRDGEQRRAGDAGELLEDREEAKVLGRLVFRDHPREERAAQRLAAALDGAD